METINNSNENKSKPNLNQSTYAGDGSSNTIVSGDFKYNLLDSQGIQGFTRFGGFVYDDFLRELQGRKGAATYREMRDNDPIIGSILTSIESLIRSVEWHVEAQGNTEADKICAEFVNSCFSDMDITWNNTLSDILTFIPYGYSVLELNYKIRRGDSKDKKYNSKYNDGLIGWRNWGIRAQETLWSWNFDRDNTVLGFTQIAPPDFTFRYIPMEKCIHFKASNNRGNPEGRSMLRNAYRPWYFKKNLEEIEGIGMEKDLTGLPILRLPYEIMQAASDPNAPEEARMAYNNWITIAKGIKRNSQAAIILPSAYDENGNKLYDIDTISTGSTRKQFDTDLIIKRYARDIAMTLMADFIMLGNNSQGSYALSDSKVSMFRQSLTFLLKVISETINEQAIVKIVKLNNFKGITDYPKIAHSNIDEKSLQETANFIQQLVNSDVLDVSGDKNLEDAMREKADLPPRSTFTEQNIQIEGGTTND